VLGGCVVRDGVGSGDQLSENHGWARCDEAKMRRLSPSHARSRLSRCIAVCQASVHTCFSPAVPLFLSPVAPAIEPRREGRYMLVPAGSCKCRAATSALITLSYLAFLLVPSIALPPFSSWPRRQYTPAASLPSLTFLRVLVSHQPRVRGSKTWVSGFSHPAL